MEGAGRLRATLLPLANRTDPRQEIALDLGELPLGDLTELEAHLRCQQLLAPHGVVGHLGILRRGNLAQDELEAADQEAVEDDHSDSRARSSFRRMLTKLYGGQGPV